MGELAARELADDLVEAWHTSEEDGVSLHAFMKLSREEYKEWASHSVLPPDFERRHQG